MIIKEYASNYPTIFRPILQSVNQFSQGLDINLPAYNNATGKYIALCEGDDYWTNDYKLQLQYDFLEKNSQLVAVFHRGFAVNEYGIRIPFVWDKLQYNCKYSQFDCIFTLLSGYPTASLFFKKEFLEPKFPEYFNSHPTDYMFDIFLTKNGPIGFQDFEGCAYRQHPGGIWSTLSLIEIQIENAKRFSSLFCNKELQAKYPELKSHFIHHLDVLWWMYFNTSKGGLNGAQYAFSKIIKIFIMKFPLNFIFWLFRKECPYLYTTKRSILNS